MERQVEHWWNGYPSGMARRDIFLRTDDDGRWSVTAMWWREQSRIEMFTSEGAARLWVMRLRELDTDTDPARWRDLGPGRRRPSRTTPTEGAVED